MLLGCDLHVFHSLSESTWRIIATWTKVILILLAWPWRWLVKRYCLTRFTRHQQISVRLVWSMFLRAWYVSWIIAQSSNCRFCIIVFFHRQFKHILGIMSAEVGRDCWEMVRDAQEGGCQEGGGRKGWSWSQMSCWLEIGWGECGVAGGMVRQGWIQVGSLFV